MKIINCIVSTLLLLCSMHAEQAQSSPLGSTGPDAFGYQGSDIAYDLRDVSSTGTFLSLSDDDMSGVIPLGFTFSFYGVDYTSLHISSNGFLDFDGGGNGCCTGHALPQVDTHEGGIIAGFWEDIDPGNGGAPAENNVRYQTLGSVGSREFVVGFYNVDHFPDGTNVTFEMILHEGSGNIEFQYLTAESDGGVHSIGIERPDETDGLQVLLQATGSPLPLATQGYLISTVPEPSTLLLGALAIVGPLTFRRRK